MTSPYVSVPEEPFRRLSSKSHENFTLRSWSSPVMAPVAKNWRPKLWFVSIPVSDVTVASPDPEIEMPESKVPVNGITVHDLFETDVWIVGAPAIGEMVQVPDVSKTVEAFAGVVVAIRDARGTTVSAMALDFSWMNCLALSTEVMNPFFTDFCLHGSRRRVYWGLAEGLSGRVFPLKI
jgi:hypothetical protein